MMKRFNYIINILRKEYPNDWWLKCYQLLDEVDDENIFNNQFAVYEKALQSMDSKAFSEIIEKIVILFKQNDAYRGKSQFFNQLNEALAYEYLKNIGCSYIKFISEKNRESVKIPDLSFEMDGSYGLCEVKTISISDNELSLDTKDKCFSSEAYKYLGSGFFKKLKYDIDNANDKMSTSDAKHIIYIIIHFDDPLMLYYPTYKTQIVEYINEEYPLVEVYFRIGLFGKHHINCIPNSLIG